MLAKDGLRSLIVGLFPLPDEQIRPLRFKTMKSYFKNLARTKRKHPRADEGDAPAGQSTSGPHTATSTTTSRPVGYESPLDGARSEACVRKEVGPAHPQLIQTILTRNLIRLRPQITNLQLKFSLEQQLKVCPALAVYLLVS